MFVIVSTVPIFKRRILTRKVIYRLFQLNVWTFQKCKNAHACALRDCLGISRPFVSDTSPKCIDREGLERRRTGTRQNRTFGNRTQRKPNRSIDFDWVRRSNTIELTQKFGQSNTIERLENEHLNNRTIENRTLHSAIEHKTSFIWF